MVSISKEEKDTILKQYPNVHIVRTMKQDSKRHHYFMEEHSGAMGVLRRLRGISKKEGVDNRRM